MSTNGISTTENLLSPRAPQVSPQQREIVLNSRLDALREIALSLLTELDDEVKRFEIDLIRAALDRAHGNQSRASRILGIKKTTLNAKIKRYQIQPAGRDFDAPMLTERRVIAA
jgi:DNA-binding NtrC family response regulator